jgi:spore germination protein GerM
MGSSVPTTNVPLVPTVVPIPETGVRAWMASLAPRDRLVYALMLAMLALIVAIYIVVGLQSLAGMPAVVGGPTAVPSASAVATSVGAGATIAPAASPLASVPAQPPTSLPTSTPSAQPTAEPTDAPAYFPPTTTALSITDLNATSTAQALGATAAATATTQAQPSAAANATSPAQPTATTSSTVSQAQPTAAPSATRTAPTATLRPRATAQPRPTSAPVAPTTPPAPTAAVIVPQPTVQLPPTPMPQPAPSATPAPPVTERRNEVVWLYFGDETGTLFVPVQRQVTVENRQSARTALQALFAGPRDGMAALVDGSTQLLDIRIENGTAIVNLDRNPGDDRAYDAIVLTLTHFSTIKHVQIQVGGQNIGGPRNRPIVNPLNPLGLPVDYGQTEFLPLYFVSNSGYHVRVIRMVPKTRQTAEGTVRALLEGPGAYSYALRRVIPEGTDLRGISIARGVVTVDFTQAFADTGDRGAAVRTVTESLTTLPTVRGVQILVEGAPVSSWWGQEYARVFERSLINAE